MDCNESAGQILANRQTHIQRGLWVASNHMTKLPKADACLVDFGVARVFADQQEVGLATDAPSDSATVPLDVVLGLTTVQGIQSASDDQGLALQAVGVTQGLVLSHTCTYVCSVSCMCP